MKTIVSRRDLLNAINMAKGIVQTKSSGIVPAKSSSSVLLDVLLTASEGTLNVVASDLKVHLSYNVDCAVDDPGACTISCHRLAQLLASISADEISLEQVDSSVVMIRAGKAEVRFFSHSPEDFPQIPEVTATPVAFSQSLLKSMFEKTVFCASTEIARQVLMGVLLDVKPELITMVATDSRRLSLAKTDITGESQETRVIIPAKVVRKLIGVLSNNESDVVYAYIDPVRIKFDFSRFVLVSSLIDGVFPNYEAVIPKKLERELIAKTADFAGALRAGYAMTSDTNRIVRLEAREKALVFRVRTPEVGEYVDEIAADYSGAQTEISFNPDFLLDFLRYVQSERLCMCFKDTYNPVVFKPYTEAPEESYLNVVMPVLP